MKYKHICGPIKDVGEAPYYPIQIRSSSSRSKDKLLDGEVSPDEILTKRDALNYLIYREVRSTSRFKSNKECWSGGRLSLK